MDENRIFSDLCAVSRSMFRDSSANSTFLTVYSMIEAFKERFPNRHLPVKSFAGYLHLTRGEGVWSAV